MHRVRGPARTRTVEVSGWECPPTPLVNQPLIVSARFGSLSYQRHFSQHGSPDKEYGGVVLIYLSHTQTHTHSFERSHARMYAFAHKRLDEVLWMARKQQCNHEHFSELRSPCTHAMRTVGNLFHVRRSGLKLTAVGAKPPGCDVQGQGVCQRSSGSQIKHTVRMMSPSCLLKSITGGCIRARPATGPVWVCSSWVIEAEGYRSTVIYAHPRHWAHRPAPQPHWAAWSVVAKVGRGWYCAVICGDTGKSSPGTPRRALLAPHPRYPREWVGVR